MELTVTGPNALTYPVLNIWNWVVSLYLFLVAAAAGLLVMSGLAVLQRRDSTPGQRKDVLAATLFAPLLLFSGMLTIWLELGVKQNSHWLFLSFSFSSLMFWGGWLLILTFIAGILLGLSLMTDDLRERLKLGFLKKLSLRLMSHTRPLALIGCVLGILTGIYTGVSLSLFAARPLWNSTVAPLLFLFSSMATGAALFVILSRKKAMQLFFTKNLIGLIGAEIVTIFLFFLGQLTSSPAKLLFSFDKDWFLFIITSVLIGICVPLALVLTLLREKEECSEEISGTVVVRMKLSACLVLTGGLIIRLGWVYLGQLIKLS
ncbi:MAG: NrfD/PsrC family molybdoenzyme membrane anchor subunit [Syntrophobacteraceae bacterium]